MQPMGKTVGMSAIAAISDQVVLSRLVRRSDLVACKQAFIDCKLPGSEQKENYSIIGPGVSESSDQVVNLSEPHGFSLGVAAMPPGVTNNLHIHYTAEVFMIFRGEWLFRWGADGKDGEFVGRAGDVVSIPTWIFRGFTNVGSDDGWIFTCLGRDECGGLIWHPSILKSAAQYGLYLTREDVVVDTGAGAAKPDDKDLVTPLSDEVMAALDRYSVKEMRERIVVAGERPWSDRALLDACLPGHRSSLAPIVGPGMSEDRKARPKVTNPHGFSVEWLRIEAGQIVGPLRVAPKQVLIVYEGAIEVTVNRKADAVTVPVGVSDLYSVPAGAWRSLQAVGPGQATVAVITAGDGRVHIEWDSQIVQDAQDSGFCVDPDGYIAAAALLSPLFGSGAGAALAAL
ncbi:MAG: hypothetical protein ABIQ87_00695 [Rubrivivax sp.]